MSRQPLQPKSYRAAAKRLRQFAQALEDQSQPRSARELAALTSSIHGLARFASALSRRHRAAGDRADAARKDEDA